MSEQVSKASSNLYSYLSKGGYIVVPTKEWVDFITLSGRDSKEITTQLVAKNRAGILAEGIFIVLGNEMADSYHVTSLEEAISKWSSEPVSDEVLKTEELTPEVTPKEEIPKSKNSKSKPPER